MNLFRPSRPGRTSLRRAVVAVASAGLLAGCGTDTGSGGAPSGSGTATEVIDLAGSWHLQAGADPAGDLPLDGAPAVTLIVDGATVSGTSACNSYSGDVSVEAGGVAVTGLGGTEMACEPAVMELEQRYLAALESMDRARRSADTLTLTGSDATLTFSLDPPVADARLTGTTWRLESLVDGESVSSTEPGGLLVLSNDGTWRASSGCGDLRGGYRLSGSTVTVTERRVQVADGACSELALAQHAQVAGVLSGSFEVAVDGDRLRITAADGRGLEYRAQ